MDIYQRIKDDHGKQRGLLGAIDETAGESDERKRLFDELKRELESHANAEEQTFYAELIAKPEAQQKARHSVVEHDEAHDLLKELEETDMASGAWLQKFRHLRERVEHHLDEEEEEVFVRARKLIPDARAKALATAFDKRKSAEAKAYG